MNQEISQRLSQIAQGEVPTGYQKTKVGRQLRATQYIQKVNTLVLEEMAGYLKELNI